MNFIEQTPLMLSDFAIKSISRIKNKRGQLFSMVSLIPLAACGGGGGSPATTTPPPPPEPDYTENPSGTFTARDDANLTLSLGSATTDLTVNSKDGNDTITTGSGHDVINGAGGNDTIDAGDGNDVIDAGEGNNVITDSAGDNIIATGGGNNNITVADGNDTISTGAGNDTINAGLGNNIISAGSGDNTITTESGDDTISVSSGTNTITSGAGNDIITGGSGADAIVTADGNDTITSGDGNDIIRAGAGNDSVDAGGGDDIIVVVGTTGAGEYAETSITNPGGSGMDISSVLSLAELNDHVTSDAVAGEVIDGGADADTLMIYGTVDLTGITILNIENIQVNSTLTLTASQFELFTNIGGDGSSILNIVNDTGVEPLVVDLSNTSLADIATLTTTGDVQIIISSADDLAGLANIERDGNLTLVLADDGTGTNAFNLSDLAAVIDSVDAIEVEATVTIVVDDTTSVAALTTSALGGGGTIVISDAAASDPTLLSGVIVDEDITVENTSGTALVVEDFGGALIADIEPSDGDILPEISIADISVNEADATADFTVSLDVASGKEITVDYSLNDGTLVTLTFAAGETSKTVTAASWTDDSLDEDTGDTAQTLVISNPVNATLGTSTATLTIADDDDAPTISINDITANEADETDTFTVTLSAASGKEITVDYTAPDGSTGTLTFAAGETTQTFSSIWIDDTTDESDEVVTATLSNPTNVTIADATGTLSILDNDTPPTISIDDISTNEADETDTFTVTLSAASGKEITVDYTAPDGTTGTLTFAAGETTQTFTSGWTDDSTDEADEVVTATLSNPSNATITDDTGSLTIADDDDAPTISVADLTVNEADSTADFTVSLDAASGKEISVDYSLNDGTLVTLTFAAGETSKTVTAASWTDDSTDETVGDTGQTLVISNPVNATLGTSSATLTIADDDAAPTISIDDISADEVDETDTFTVSLSAASGKEVTVDYAAPDGTTGTLTFAAGETTQTFTTAWTDDSTDEWDEIQTAMLSSPTNATLLDESGTLTILDDDDAPSMSINDITLNEADETGTFTVSLSAVSGKSITVEMYYIDFDGIEEILYFDLGDTTVTFTARWSDDNLDEADVIATAFLYGSGSYATITDAYGTLTILDDDTAPTISIDDITANEADETDTFTVSLSAASGKEVTVDYTAPDGTTGTLTFAVGVTTQTFTTAWTDDTIAEADEVVTATLSNPSNATIADSSGALTILDNDTPPTISIDDISANEADETATYTVSLSAPFNQEVTVDYIAPDGTTGTLTFAAGETTRTFATAWIDDSTDEADEAVTATLSNPTNATIVDNAGTLTILDDDTAPTISIDDITANEADETDTFTVSLSTASGKEVTVDYTAPDGTTGTLTFAVGVTTQTFTTAWTDDTIAEADEVVTATLSNPSNATIADSSGALTIIDEDTVPGISIDDISTNEVDETDTFTVSLSAASSQTVTVDYTAPDGTTGTLTFAAGVTTQTFSTAWTDDSADEADEVVTATLTNPTNATILDSTGKLTILNDDSAQINITNITVNEGDGTASFTVSLIKAVAQDVTFDWTTSNDTAFAGTHYAASGGTAVTVPAGETSAIITVPITDDTIYSGSTRFTVTLSNINGPAFAGTISAQALITDNDALVTDMLDGNIGFVINGVGQGDHSGGAVSSAGDVDGDGYDDFLIGGSDADSNGLNQTGRVWLVYGGTNIDGGDGILELSTLNGSNGLVINGVDTTNLFGASVAGGGDIDGDGYVDIIMSARGVRSNDDPDSGSAYVLYGDSNINNGESVLELSSLDGTNGFELRGIISETNVVAPVSIVGDLNDDGYADLVIGGNHIDPNNITNAGQLYVVYGGPDIDGIDGDFDLSTLDGTNGFVLNGYDDYGYVGKSVSSIGDVNGDGIEDLVVGAFLANSTGETYVIYGGSNIDGGDGIFDLSSLDGVNGYKIQTSNGSKSLGYSVSNAGDINGDGIDDLFISATNNTTGYEGAVYVVYGGDAVDGGDGLLDISVLNGTNGFIIRGINDKDHLGFSAAIAGDINGDGYDDFIFSSQSAGDTYLVYGGEAVDGGDGIFDLSSLNGTNGYVINVYHLGTTVSGAGDVNGDGFDDLLVGADGIATNDISGTGQSYIIYGVATSIDVYMGTTGNDTMTGSANNERFTGRGGNDTITSGAGADMLVFDGAWGDDTVTDFEDGVDLFDLRDADLTFADLTITQSGTDALIEDGLGNSITLTGITSTDITADDFIF